MSDMYLAITQLDVQALGALYTALCCLISSSIPGVGTEIMSKTSTTA